MDFRIVATRPNGVPIQGALVDIISTVDGTRIGDVLKTDNFGQVIATGIDGPFFPRLRLSGTQHNVQVTVGSSDHLFVGGPGGGDPSDPFEEPVNTEPGDITAGRLILPDAALWDSDLLVQVAGPVAADVFRMYDDDHSNFIGHQAPSSVASDLTYTWPSTAPTLGQALVSTAPSGGVAALSWDGPFVAPHNLLDGGTAHLDTATDSVSRGSFIFGNSTPAWDEFVIGAAGSVMWSDGTDPSWTINLNLAGYLHAGSSSAPTNTTAGDVTGERLVVGDDGTSLGGNDFNGRIGRFTGTVTSTSGNAAGIAYSTIVRPAANSTLSLRGTTLTTIIDPSTGVTPATTVVNIFYDTRFRFDSSTLATYIGFALAANIDTSDVASAITTYEQFRLDFVGRPSGNAGTTLAVANAVLLNMRSGRVGAGVSVSGTYRDIYIAGQNFAAIADYIGIDVEAPTTPPSGINLPVRIRQAASDRTLLQLITTATNDDPTRDYRQARVATTNATQTTLATITIPATTTVKIRASVVARRTGGAAGTAEDGAGYEIVATVKNVAGTATLIGAVAALVTQEDQAAWDATIDVTGATARVRVTGAVDNTVTWHATYEVEYVST